MSRIPVGIIVLASVLSLTGCSRRITDFTIISTKNVDVTAVSTSGARVTGVSCKPVVIFPFGVPDLKDAIDDAIEKAGPQFDALVDGVVYYRNKSFIFGSICYEVEGTAIATKSDHSSVESPNLEVALGTASILYHSRLGISNDLNRIKFVELKDGD